MALLRFTLNLLRSFLSMLTGRGATSTPGLPVPGTPIPSPVLPPPAAVGGLTTTPGGGTPGIIPVPASAPSVRIIAPAGGISGVPVPVRYDLVDPASSLLTLTVEYSTDGGATFHAAAEDLAVANDGTSGLGSSPAGVGHLFAWHARADLPAALTPDVVVRLTASNSALNATATSQPFTVDARVIAQPSKPYVVPMVPRFTGPQVPVHFVVADRDGSPVQMIVECRQAGGTWTPAIAAQTSDLMDRLPAPEIEVDYRFVWAADRNYPGQSGTAELRFTPVKPGVSGDPGTTGPFAFDTAPKPPPAPLAPPVPTAIGLQLLNTNPIEGLAGRLLRETILVRAVDALNQQPVPGVTVSFTVDPAGVGVDILDDTVRMVTTDRNGVACVRVRTRRGGVGPGAIVAEIPGLVGARQSIPFTVAAPTIVHDPLPSTPLRHGARYTIGVAYGDRNRQLFGSEPFRPVRIGVECTNALASCTELHLPAKPGVGIASDLSIVPIWDSTGSGRIRLVDLDDPTISVDIPFSIVSPHTQRRTALPGLSTTGMHTPVPMRVVPVSGLGTSGKAQVGYSGLTLAVPFRVSVMSGGVAYDEEALDNQYGCTVTPTPGHPVKVTYTASGGRLSASTPPTATSASVVQTDVTTPVFFAPSGPGPWFVMASITSPLLDPYAVALTSTSGGVTTCQRNNFLQFGSDFVFIVQVPSAVRCVKPVTTSGPAPGYDWLDAGDPFVVEVAGLSDTLPGTPDQLTLTSLLPAGTAPPAYTGYAFAFEQKIALDQKPGNFLRSDVVTVVRGQPNAAPALRHAVLPGGWLRLHGDSVEAALPVAGRPFRRDVAAGIVSLQDTIVGTSPAEGAQASVLLHNGEFIHLALDLSLVSRPRPINVHRTFRSHVRCDGPLGPGWSIEHFGHLDVTRTNGLRWINGLGRVDEFPDDMPTPGHCVEVTRNTTITGDRSAFEIADPQRSVIHYNVDGSLRFLCDRLGNRIEYTHNLRGQLVEIKDPWQSRITFEYVPDGATIRESVGKLRSITHKDRVVEFAYYGAGDPDGSPGWLKSVVQPEPKSDTVFDAVQSYNARYSETYLYRPNPVDRLGIRLLKIVTGNNFAQIDNRYDGQNRLHEQIFQEQRACIFDYDPANRRTTFTDRRGNRTEVTFAASAFADAATAVTSLETPNPAAGPGAPTRQHAFRHNFDGRLVSWTDPANAVTEWVYDERASDHRARGNLLALHRRGGGEARSWSFSYQRAFNLVEAAVPPRGNAPGESPETFGTRNRYDARGQLERITHPRTMNNVVRPSGAHRTVLWIEDSPHETFTHNAFGLVKEHQDEQGVVHEYRYFPVGDPFGTGGSAGSVDGGGLLASVTHDTKSTPQRDMYLPGVATTGVGESYRYDDLGNLLEKTDSLGLRTRTESNRLNQIVKITTAAGAPDESVERQVWDEFGHVAVHELDLPAVPGKYPAGTVVQKQFWKPAARKIENRESFRPTPLPPPAPPWAAPVEQVSEIEVDENDNTSAMKPADTTGSTPASQAWLGVDSDAHGQPLRVRQGAGTGTPLQFEHEYSKAGNLKEVRAPDGIRVTAYENAFSEPDAVHHSSGHAEQALTDRGGIGSRLLGQANASVMPVPAGANVTRVQEAKIDEWGRLRRLNEGIVVMPAPGAAPAPATPSPVVPDHYPAGTISWPPAVPGGLLKGGAWDPDDGRMTEDILYDVCDRPVRLADDETGWIFHRYDAHGRVIEAATCIDDVAPYYNLSTFEYDPVRRQVDSTHVDHSSDRSRPQSRTFPERELIDIHGRVVRRIDGRGNAVDFEYDRRGNVVRSWDAVGYRSAQTFNGATVNDPGNLTSYEFDERGRLTKVETILTQTGHGGAGPHPTPHNSTGTASISYRWDDAGRLTSWIDWAHNLASYRYDGHGRLESVRYTPSAATGGAAPATHRNVYDPQGQLAATIDANGTVITLAYDSRHFIRTRSIVTPGTTPRGSRILLSEYDDNDHLSVAEDLTAGLGHRCTFVNDSEGRPLLETSGGVSISRRYDGVGRCIGVDYPNGLTVTYGYDRAGRLRSIADGTSAFTLHHLGAGRPLSWTCNGITATVTYDAAGRPSRLAYDGLAAGTLSFDTDRDRAGRITDRNRRLGAVEIRLWDYDSAGRLVSEIAQPFPGSGHPETQTRMQFDGDGVVRECSLTFPQTPGAPTVTHTYTREERGRVISADGVTLRYDRNGNLLDDGVQQYEWDGFDRLIAVTRAGTAFASFAYDALGRLIRQTSPAGTETYVYCGDALIEAHVMPGGAPPRVERFIHSPATGQVIAADIGGVRYLVLFTPEGSVDSLVDPQRQIVESYDYSVTGTPMRLSSTRQALAGRPLCRLLHHGQMFDHRTGLYWYRMRWYHPRLGIFLSPDPAGPAEGTNHYGFNHGDPINRRDPSGTQSRPAEELGSSPSWGDIQATFSLRNTSGWEGLKALGGIGIALWGMVRETALNIVDFGGGIMFDRYKPRSQLGQYALGDGDYADMYLGMGKSIVMTPVRAVRALEQGDAWKFGEEAFNFYCVATMARSVARGVFNYSVKGIGMTGRSGLLVQTRIRQFQVWTMKQRMRLNLALRRAVGLRSYTLDVSQFRYSAMYRKFDGTAEPLTLGLYCTDTLVLTLYERAFTPGTWLFRFARTYRHELGFRSPLGWRAALKGFDPMNAMFHEGYHSFQRPNLAGLPGYMAEFTGPGTIVEGAVNIGFEFSPVAPLQATLFLATPTIAHSGGRDR